MKCLVTGGAGFIGSHLVDSLIKKGHEVIIFDDLSTGKLSNINKKAKFYNVDISGNIRDFAPMLHNVDWVFHLAAWARVPRSIKDPIGTNKVNVTGTVNILQLCRQLMVKRLIYSSSSSVYGDQDNPVMKEDMVLKPKSPYGLQKLIGEQYCELFSRLFEMEIVSLRYFNVYGPRQVTKGAYALVIGKFLEQKKLRRAMTVYGDGKQTRSYCYVSDVVRANLLAVNKEMGEKYNVFNIGTREETSVNDVARKIGGKIRYIVPNPRGKFEERRKAADCSKAKKKLGWKPFVDFDKGMGIIS